MTHDAYAIAPTSAYRDRRPPYSEDAEQAVLAAALISQDAMLAAVEVVDDTMFYAERHRRIFRAMQRLLLRGSIIDPLTLADALATQGELESAGGKDYLGFLVDAVPTAANIAYHAGIVREKAQLRRLIEAAVMLQGEAFGGGQTSQELARAATDLLLPLSVDDAGAAGFRSIKDSVWAVMEDIEARAAGKIVGVMTGYQRIDAEAGGFNEGEFIVIGGAEGMGKSAMALNIALRVALAPREKGGGGCAYVSAEMSREALTRRCLSYFSRIDGKVLRTGRLVDDDFPNLASAGGILTQLPLWIDDEAEPSLADVTARCTHLKAMHPEIRLFVVDFLQLVHAREKHLTESIELKRIAYALKGMAKRLKVVVVAPCQINSKEVEDLKDARPRLKDLQGSSGMRQAADFIGLMFRPAVYDSSLPPSDLEVYFGKAREAAPFLAKLSWHGPTLTISDPYTPSGRVA